MANATIRPFKINDLEQVVLLQNQCMPQDSVNSAVFQRKVLLDQNFDLRGCLVAEDQGKIVGFILGLRRLFKIEDSPDDSDKGWITLFFVHPDYREQGIGTALLEACESFLRSENRKTVWISSYAPNYFIPGVDVNAHEEAHRFLQHHGYVELVRPLSMDARLIQLETPDWVKQKQCEREQEGYRFEFFTPERTLELLDFMKQHFPGDWQRFAREKMTGITLGRNLPDEITLAIKDNKIEGFAQFEGERFGPFGVNANLRGNGLGAILLFKTLNQMRAKGMHNAWFLWTSDQVAKLYSVAGFVESRRFALLRKEL
jgi:GNAT superfamily N-acetyltransferase